MKGATPRRFAVLGDSISTYAGCNPPGYAVFFEGERIGRSGLEGPCDTWWAHVAAHFGAEVVANASWSGSMVEGAGMPAGEDPRRAADLAGAPGQVPTDVLVFMGTNDYGWGSAHAQAAGRSTATPAAADLDHIPPAVAGLADKAGLAGFGRAYARMLANVRAALPDARVWCVSLMAGRLVGSAGPAFCWNLRGVPMRAYNEAIACAAAAEPGCSYVDAAGFGLDYEAVDGTHPTVRGMRQIAALVVAGMEGQAADGVAVAWGYPDAEGGRVAWASRELCPDRACVGCAHARNTGNAWSCVCERGLIPG